MQMLAALISSAIQLNSCECLRTPKWWPGLDQSRRKWILGLSFITTVAVIWVVASFVVQEVEKKGLHPFLLSYIANSLFVVYLPIHWIASRSLSEPPSKPQLSPLPTREDTEEAEGPDAEEACLHQSSSSAEVGNVATAPSLGKGLPEQGFWSPFNDKATFKAAAVVAPLWFLAQYTFNTSLHLTTVTSNTILSQTSSIFTYALACTLALEILAARKVAFILVCMAGVSLVAYVDNSGDKSSSEEQHSLLGDFLCLLSACFYAAYTVAIRVMLKDDESASMMLFFGFVGALNLVCLAPVLALLWGLSVVDPWQLSAKMFALTVGKGLFDNALSDYLWARAVLLIGPTVATLGLSLQFPIAAGADVVTHSPSWLHNGAWPLMLIGSLTTLAGFFGINIEDWGCFIR